MVERRTLIGRLRRTITNRQRQVEADDVAREVIVEDLALRGAESLLADAVGNRGAVRFENLHGRAGRVEHGDRRSVRADDRRPARGRRSGDDRLNYRPSPCLNIARRASPSGSKACWLAFASMPALVTLIACTCKSGRLANASFTASSNVAASTASGGFG